MNYFQCYYLDILYLLWSSKHIGIYIVFKKSSCDSFNQDSFRQYLLKYFNILNICSHEKGCRFTYVNIFILSIYSCLSPSVVVCSVSDDRDLGVVFCLMSRFNLFPDSTTRRAVSIEESVFARIWSTQHVGGSSPSSYSPPNHRPQPAFPDCILI